MNKTYQSSLFRQFKEKANFNELSFTFLPIIQFHKKY